MIVQTVAFWTVTLCSHRYRYQLMKGMVNCPSWPRPIPIPSPYLVDLSDGLSCDVPTELNQFFHIHAMTLKTKTACSSKMLVSTYKTHGVTTQNTTI
jgi:hypothetical protein